ncbi:TetR/AcrR family transcriptional regulator [uncultured Paraglaciecola sp.]|uniref:TetR/AcrR family transcriptional regulator n=1 Tax=uncultured Paraglaciecola sp. TaxID=1765024 RepID=UPI0030DA3C18
MATTTCTQMGRPRAFDAEKALENALQVFWQKGYEGASLSDLTSAMGINKPSLYSAFGNKEQLFLKAIELYEQRPCNSYYPALEKSTAFEVAEYMLRGAANNLADTSHPQGCIVVQGALSCSEAGSSVKQALIAKRLNTEQELCDRFIRAQAEGDLPASADPTALAKFLGTVMQGMAIQATSGASAEQLMQVAELSLLAFPRA